LGNDRPLRWSR